MNTAAYNRRITKNKRILLTYLVVVWFFVILIVVYETFGSLEVSTVELEAKDSHLRTKTIEDSSSGGGSTVVTTIDALGSVAGTLPRVIFLNESTYRKITIADDWRFHFHRGRNNTDVVSITQHNTSIDDDDDDDDDEDEEEPLSWRLNASRPECNQPPEWRTFHPTCNIVHEIDLSLPNIPKRQYSAEERSSILTSKGSIRLVWNNTRTLPPPDYGDAYVLKTLHYAHNLTANIVEQNRFDGVALEKLTFSPYVIDEYGFCGVTTVNEHADEELIHVLKRRVSRGGLLPGLEELKMARDLAVGLGHIHRSSYGGGSGRYSGLARNVTMVHNDVNTANVLVKNGTIKYHDFNLGDVLPFDEVTGRYCDFPATHFSSAQWRSPEELRARSDPNTTVTEKIDVYSLGNLFYTALNKHKPWAKLETEERQQNNVVFELKLRGEMPYFPPEVTADDADLAVRALYLATRLCYTFDVERRPRAGEVADLMTGMVDVLEGSRVDSFEELVELFPLLEDLE
mmetsp:Transcript_47141/g.57047  ORF Transcript_47141/g.57047 Transcript_47141/m.57047 type:complete len:514 (-) Transcript_47141:23-1564(-)|eukprot:CAMPEP_0172524170 /NCGR_PEP_ID=MMETSP1066-20121228/294047_1 /TAXON_ID=671091 /ORGANISM="Coscinodiscus wailesii, Strain CCMP2513" /LENGTH=513 /DNA_ID=CAMNT_0013307285 /DNA_START=91 /DNA_END=1632 /DNA_ORIENTATION=+